MDVNTKDVSALSASNRVIVVGGGKVYYDRLRKTCSRSRTAECITHCNSAKKVRSQLKKALSSSDVLIVNPQLNDVSGLEWCLELLQKQPPCALLLLVEPGDEAEAARALDAGVHGVLIQDPQQNYLNLLPATIRAAINGYQRDWGCRNTPGSASRSIPNCSALGLMLAAMEHAGSALILTSAPLDDASPEILYTNPRFSQITGYSTTEAIGQPIDMLQVPHGDRDPGCWHQTIRTDETDSSEIAIHHKDDCSTLFKGKIKPIRSTQGQTTYWVIILHDDTDRSHTETLLKKRQEQSDLAFESARVVPWEMDLATWCFTYIDPHIESLMGYPVRSWYEPNFWKNHLHSEDRDWAFDFCTQQTKRSINHDFEYRMIKADGSEIWIRDHVTVVYKNDQPVSLRGTFLDISEIRFAKNAFLKSEVRFQQLVDHIHEVFWLSNPDLSKMHYISPAYEKIWGHPCAEVYDKPSTFIDAIHPEDRDRAMRLFVNSPSENQEGRFRVIPPNGCERWVRVRTFPVYDEHGQKYQLAGLAEDMTEQYNDKIKTEQVEGQLVHIARIGLLGEMSTALAHELNQPLAAIATYTEGCLEYLRTHDQQDAGLVDAMENVTRLTLRAGDIIRRLRKLVRKDAPQRSEVRINELLREVLKLIEYESKTKGVTLHQELAEDLPILQIDAIQTQQVILNLLRNALDAMDQVNLSKRQLTVRSALKDDHTLEVVVSDTGPGLGNIAEDQLFEPFVSTKPAGLGMGLAISRSIIEAHDGQLWAQSNANQGASFGFNLPVQPIKNKDA